jgi:hypothetical protein
MPDREKIKQRMFWLTSPAKSEYSDGIVRGSSRQRWQVRAIPEAFRSILRI